MASPTSVAMPVWTASSKRKPTHPHRSLSAVPTTDNKADLGIIRLDVYSVFQKNPKNLLYSKSSRQAQKVGLLTNNGTNQGSGVFDIHSQSGSEQQANVPAPAAVVRVPKRRGRPPSSAARLNQSTRDVAKTASNESSSTGQTPQPIPNIIYDAAGKPIVTWPKNEPVYIPPDTEGYDELSPAEVQTCSILRIIPIQYIKVKEALLLHKDARGAFKKREAQKICRIDVNKTGKIFDWFVALGWLINPDDTIQQ